ncbi:hypothetical protein CFHF_17515 [Caulobacter flavus]|uniref:Uncharacterized protein n=1 Tax=Caulobacter flavus TaxID=1679497 RepID=A0A2N5CQN3_9CAUL|nr:hypothetical protein [Caulobacter flavus]AYV48777.1 hypothetical protein C1707_22350 [Caulobacter flavus]PLR10309.1 hypothetical protein CFHF_17515 [Caulobacter flavus]
MANEREQLTQPRFVHLNPDWNAEPNAPCVHLVAESDTVSVSFLLNPHAYDAEDGEVGKLTFPSCRRWRLDATNDEGWFAGRGRFAGVAPAWGEFYEIVGDDPTMDALDWEPADGSGSRHFLFYFRDEAFECLAGDWTLTRLPAPAA